jgi:NAD-dependent SIR2 family protein deacetylase
MVTLGLSHFARAHPRLLVLSGAGISTASGIPDYRDGLGQWKRKPPVTLQEFTRSAVTRRRYWARSMVGWPIIADAKPNAAHCALARLEAAGTVERLVTMNVDGLHQRAGSVRVIELHGNIAAVSCIDCDAAVSRLDVQRTLETANADHVRPDAVVAPDGDADFDVSDFAAFRVPECPRCGGILKPGVVFFGDVVPRNRVDATMQALDLADAMLVVGSSLMVHSGYRYCESAHRMGKPVAAINLGRTRADHLFRLKIERPCVEVLTELAHELDLPAVPPLARSETIDLQLSSA